MDLKEIACEGVDLDWLRIGTSGGLFWFRKRVQFFNCLNDSVSRGRLCSMELVKLIILTP